MFGRSSITYIQPRQIIVSNFYSFLPRGLRIFLISCSGTSCQKGYVSEGFNSIVSLIC